LSAGIHLTDDSFTLPDDAELLEQRLLETEKKLGPVRLLVIDTVADVQGYADDSKNGDMRRVMRPLRDIAARLGTAVLCIAHLRKGGDGRVAERVIGSVAVVNVARSVLFVVPDDSDPDLRVVALAKSNLARTDGPGFRCRIYRPQDDAPLKVEWLGPVDIDEQELARRLQQQSGRDGDITDAKAFLVELLADGGVRQSVIREKAKEVDIKWRTLERAKSALGVLSRKLEFAGGWEWYLPEREPGLDGGAF
jgi:hypothetical protein